MLDQEGDPRIAEFLRGILDKSAALRLPELFESPPAGALYHLPDRHGVSVVALRTTDFSHVPDRVRPGGGAGRRCSIHQHAWP